MVKKLIRCVQCGKVIPQYDLFGDFGADEVLPGVEWASDDLDEQKEFRESHRHHTLEELWVDRETFVSERPAFEPCKVAYVEASNGRERFLVKRIKEGYDRPAFYEIITGKIRVADLALETREDELTQPINWLNRSFSLPADKAYGRPTESGREKGLHRCEENFRDSEFPLITRFIHDLRQPDNLLDLKVKKTISISGAAAVPSV